MSIKTLLFILFLYVCLVWVGAAYFCSGPEFRQTGLLWTGAGLLALLLFLLAARLITWWRGRRAAKAAAPKIRPATPEPVDEQHAALRSILAEANAALGKIPAYAATRGGNPLSTLPMYLLVGPQDSGKTATFLNSGLEPTMLTGQGSDNLNAAARPCTLWLARNAVFVEISGRVFSGDAARWMETLRLLRGGEPVSRWQAVRGIHPATANLRAVVAFCDTKEFTSAPQDPQRFERGYTFFAVDPFWNKKLGRAYAASGFHIVYRSRRVAVYER